MRQSSKTTSEALADAAERQRAVRCQTQPVEDWQFTLAPVQASPRILGEICRTGKFSPWRSLFSLDRARPVSLFSGKTEKREMGGAAPDTPGPGVSSSRPRGADSEGIQFPPPARARKNPPAQPARGVKSRGTTLLQPPKRPSRPVTGPSVPPYCPFRRETPGAVIHGSPPPAHSVRRLSGGGRSRLSSLLRLYQRYFTGSFPFCQEAAGNSGNFTEAD